MKHKFCLFVLLLLSCVGARAQGEEIVDTTRMSYYLFMSYYRVNYTYKSVAPDGTTPVTLSAAMLFPKKVFERTGSVVVDGKEYDASGLLLNNHYTLTKGTDAPTLTSDMEAEAPFVTLGPSFISIVPDGYGFGATEDKPQAYLMADATARNSIDAVKAARRLLSEMNYTYGQLFAQVGYSQGGHSAMAVQRYVDTHDADAEGIVAIDYTLCGGGPYDIRSMLDSMLLPNVRYTYPCVIPLLVQGQVESAGLDVSYSDCLQKPLDTKALEWLNAKAYTSNQINDSIYAAVGGDRRTGATIADILVTENFTNGKLQPVVDALQENSLIGGWCSNDVTRFFLYHSSEDEVVSYSNMEHMRDFLSDECGVGDDRLEVYTATGGHLNAAIFFITQSISRLSDMEKGYLSGEYIPLSVRPVVADVTMPTARAGWYNLQGQRLPGRPHAAGLYVHDGRKVVVDGR